jgi:nitrile hydratase accessory protein
LDKAMTDSISLMAGPEALPRRNGELTFNHPWESRVFAVTFHLCQQGYFEWTEFREQLISQIQSYESKQLAKGEEPNPNQYYENWLAAFKVILEEKKVLSSEDIDRTLQTIKC